MAAIRVEDLEINQGEDWVYEWILTDPVTGDLMDLTTWTGKGEIRIRPGSPVLYTWSTVVGNMILSAEGKVQITVPNADSSAWLWTDASTRYDIELTNPSSKKVRLAEGNVIVSLEVTL